MASSTVRVPPDSSGKKIDCSQVSIFGDVVQRQRVSLFDPSNPASAVSVENGALNVNVQSGMVFGREAEPASAGERPSPRLFDGSVQLPPDSTGKKLDTSAITVGGDLVQRQRITLADPTDPSGLVTVIGGALNVNIVRLGGNFISVLTPANGDVLTFDTASNRWVARQPTGGGPTTPTFYFADAEVVNGSGTSWGLAYIPDPVTSLQLFEGGRLLIPYVDYTLSGSTVTTAHPFASGAIVAWYRYTDTTPQPPPVIVAPTVAGVLPNSGTTEGGTSVTITGTGFFAGATVSFGGTAATSVNVINTTTITAVTPARAAGVVTVTVTVGGQPGSLPNAYTYVTPPDPIVSSVSPDSGTTAGGTAITITGANFASGATVTFGGSAATGVSVVNSTTITATTPARPAGVATVTVTVSGRSGSLADGYTYVTPAPTVTGVSPATGMTAGGTTVTITGTNFAAGATVTFGGVAATGVNVSSGTSLTATTPAGIAGAVDVVVTVGGQSGTRTNGFTYIAPPTVTSVSPDVGGLAGGTVVTISGTNFFTPASVTFGGIAATGVTVVSNTSITATTPAHIAGTVAVAVTSSGQSGSLTNAFTYVTVPTISSLSPVSGPLAGGTAVTITGGNFAAGATVTFGGTLATNVSVVSSTSITCTTPAHSAGAVTVQVTVSGESGSRTNAFTYAGAPTVTSLSPNSGLLVGGTPVTITGTNFFAGATVTFDGVAATSVVVASNTSITANTPAGAAGAVTVSVTSSGQSGSLPNGFTYVAPQPTVTSISPTSGTTAGGTIITITGTNFASGATVTVGGVAATNIIFTNATTMTVTSPAGAAGAATVTVTVSGQSGSLPNGYTYVAPPTVTNVSPSNGWATGGTAVTITGTNFVSGATVTFGGTAATSVVVVNATTITCNTPARAAGPVSVQVTVSGVSGSMANAFTYDAVATGVYVGIGGPGAAASPITLSGTQITLSNGVVLNQVKTTAEAIDDVFPSASTWFTPNEEHIYLLLNNGSRTFLDQLNFPFGFSPPITVTITGKTMYLYRSQAELETFGNGWRVKVLS